jgi:peptidyl-prolyl cis-trans isomerase D
VQEASKLNFFVTDGRVAQTLLDIEPFYEDGAFSRLRYKNYLMRMRMTEGQFEDKIRRDEVIQKMSRIIGYAAQDVPLVDDFDSQIDQAQVNVAYVRIGPNRLKNPSADQVKQYIEANGSVLKKYYDDNQSEFTTPDQTKARHILVKAKDDKEESMAEAKKKIDKIRQEATPENFADLAKKHSEDPGSKTRGGDLGFFPRGRMVPAFDKMAFSAEIGKITEPVKTKFGYHILLVEERKTASIKSFEEVKEQIARKKLKTKSYDELVTQVKNQLKEKKYEDIEKLLSEKGMKWTNTGFFPITRDSIPGIGQNPQFLDEAVSLGADKEYAGRLVYQGDTAYLLKFQGAKLDANKKTNPQMDFFKQLMRNQKIDMMVQSWGNSLKEQARVKLNQDLLR